MKPPPRLAAVAQRQQPKMNPSIDTLITWMREGWKCSILRISDQTGVRRATVVPIEPAG